MILSTSVLKQFTCKSSSDISLLLRFNILRNGLFCARSDCEQSQLLNYFVNTFLTQLRYRQHCRLTICIEFVELTNSIRWQDPNNNTDTETRCLVNSGTVSARASGRRMWAECTESVSSWRWELFAWKLSESIQRWFLSFSLRNRRVTSLIETVKNNVLLLPWHCQNS